MTSRVSLSYLKRQLALDPRIASVQIVSQRNEALGSKSLGSDFESTRGPRVDRSADIADAIAAIATIRRDFWSITSDNLEQQLSAIDARHVPELAQVIQRLKQAAELRSEFPKLAAALKRDLKFFQLFKAAITLPPRDLAGQKETIVRSILGDYHARRFGKSASLIRTNFPALYALQPDWIDDIINFRSPARRSNVTFLNAGLSLRIPLWVWGIIFVVLLRACGRIFQ